MDNTRPAGKANDMSNESMSNPITECDEKQMAYYEGKNDGAKEAFDFCIDRVRHLANVIKEMDKDGDMIFPAKLANWVANILENRKNKTTI